MTNDHTERGLTPDANGRMLDDLGNEYRNEDGTHERAGLNYYDVTVSYRSTGRIPVLAKSIEEAVHIAETLARSGSGIMLDITPDDDSVVVEDVRKEDQESADAQENRLEALEE